MANGISVAATLSAEDKGFLSAIKNALKAADTLGGKLKGDIGFDSFKSTGKSAVNAVKGSISGLNGEMNSSSATWKTLQGDMEQTANSSSNMAGSLTQLETAGTKNTASLVKGFGGLKAIGKNAVDAVKGSISGLVGEMNSSSAVWKTFQANMELSGKTQKQISATKKELQAFADQTIYRSSDMAGAFTQLDAAGTKNTMSLVKGFGGLAAAAENPQQAFKELSQQAAQMAAKPTVQWEGFKAMLDQTPAGVAAVAKQMGMSTQDMIKNVQAGKIKTEDFFNAIEKTGTSKAFQKLAAEYKTADQAMGGLTGTISDKLRPAFDVVSDAAIKGIGGIIDEIGKIDGEALAEKVSAGLKKAQPYWDAFKAAARKLGDVLKKVGGFLLDHADTISKVIPVVLGVVGAYKGFNVVSSFVPGLKKFSGSILQLAKKGIGKIAGKLFKVSDGAKAVGKSSKGASKATTSLKDGFNSFQKSAGIALIIGSLAGLALAMQPLASLGTTAIAPLATFGVVVGGLALILSKFGTGLQTNAVGIGVFAAAVSVMALAMQPLAALGTTAIAPLAAFGVVIGGLAFVMANFGTSLQTNVVGIGVFAAAVSMMALAMAPIASTGTEGAVAMGAFGLVVGGLAAIFAIFGTALNAAIPGMLAFGATILMVGTGMSKATSFIKALTPFVKQLGDTVTQVAGAIASAVTKIAIVVGGVLCTVMQTAGNVITGVVDSIAEGFKKISDSVVNVVDAISGGLTSVLDSIAGIIESVGTSAKNAGEGFLSVADGIKIISGLSIGAIAKSLGAVALGLGKISKKGDGLSKAASGVKGIGSAVQSAGSGFNALGSMATLAINRIKAAMKGTANMAKSAGKQTGAGFTQAFQSGMNKAPSAASKAAKSIVSKLKSGKGQARTAGTYISQGFASGMESCLGRIKAAANKMVAAADAAIRAKAQIHSPSKLTKSHGRNIAIGLGIGMQKGVKSVTSAAKSLAAAAINTMKTATKTRDYEGAASKAINQYKSAMNSKVSKVTKSLNKTIDTGIKKLQKKNPKLKKEYSKIGKILKSDVSKNIKAQGNKAISATEKTLNALGKKYQEKYNKIASDRAAYFDKLSDYGSLYSVDSYGFVALKDFKAQTSQVKSLEKNMEQLKKSLPYDLMLDIQGMDTSSALSYTNELLKKGDAWLKQYGKDYTTFINTSKNASNSYYQPDINKLDKEYNAAVTSELKKLNTQLNTIGQQATKGMVKGLTSKSSKKALKKAAKDLANILTKAIRGKLKIHSPSRVLMSLGNYAGKGFVKGVDSMQNLAAKAMDQLVEIPQIANPALAGNFGGELSADYDYYRNAQYTIIVPVEIDGKEAGRVIAPYTEAELNKRQARDNRKRGKR